jgi:hypothetical protein
LQLPIWTKKKAKKEIDHPLKDKMAKINRHAAEPDHEDKDVRCKNWDNSKCSDWLMKFPIKNALDITWLRQETASYIQTFQAAEKELRDLPDKDWCGAALYLRLVLCIVHNDVKGKYLERTFSLTREQLDGRKSADHELTAYELIADKWNDKDFNPVLLLGTIDVVVLDLSKAIHRYLQLVRRAK